MKRSLILSILIHFSILFLLGFYGCGETNKNLSNNRKNDTREIAPKKTENKEIQISIININKNSFLKKYKSSDKECNSDQYYGGLGVYLNIEFDQFVVLKTVFGYPAEKIGLEAGDVIISPGPGGLRGEVGTKVELVVLKKDGRVLTFEVIRDKICLEDKGEKAKI